MKEDTLSRTLDVIATYDPTELFNLIVRWCINEYNQEVQRIHVDTTRVGVYEEYDDEGQTKEIAITKGHTKEGRLDLKRFVLGRATNPHIIPLVVTTF